MHVARTAGLALLLLYSIVARAETPFEGTWNGAIDTPGRALEIEVEFTHGDDGLSGTISIPIQSLLDAELAGVDSDGEAVRFAIPGIPGDPSFDGTLIDEATIEGTFTQGDAEFPFSLTRENAAAEARRALEGLDGEIEQALADFNVPGLGIAVVAGGEIVYARGFGYRDLDDELPMDADTLFAIGSTTKAMTNTVLGMLVDEGRLDWDEPLRTWLPEFAVADPQSPSASRRATW